MKPNLHPLAATLSLIAIALCFAPSSNAQDDRRADRYPSTSSTTTDLTSGVYLASIDAGDHSLRRYAGQKLLNTEGAELGTIRDFIVHPQTSRVRYVVVSSGGVLGGMGNSLRLVPTEVVSRRRQPNTFVVDILQSAWLQTPAVNDADYVADRFNISAAQHGELVRRFGSASSNPHNSAVFPNIAAAGSEGLGLLRASELRGRAITAGERHVGKIENIILDLDRGTAAALVDSAGEFTGTRGKYLVPLNRLVLSPPSQLITTTLTRADFDRASPSNFAPASNAAISEPRGVEPPLSPTGRANANDRPTTR